MLKMVISKKRCKVLLIVAGVFFLVKGVSFGGIFAIFEKIGSEVSEAFNSIILGPKWEISMKTSAENNTLSRIKGMSSLSLTDPAAMNYSVTLKCRPSQKLQFSITQNLRPYVTSRTSTRSYDSDVFSFDTYYQVSPVLQIRAGLGYMKYNYGPGYQEYDPFIGIGFAGQAYGFTDVYTQIQNKVTSGFSLNTKSLQISANVGLQNKGYLYPELEDLSAGKRENKMYNWAFSADSMCILKLHPKLQTTLLINILPLESLGYYTSEGYCELLYTSNNMSITTSYELNPTIGIEVGYNYRKNESLETYGKGAERFGIGAGSRVTEQSVYYIKVDFHP